MALIAAEDGDFAWMLGEGPGRAGLRLAPGGVDAPEVLAIVRGLAARLRETHDRGAWMMVEDGEVVGLCSYLRPPDAAGGVEIGYGVAETRRGRGCATRAVAAMLGEARADPAVSVVLAATAVANLASQKALERNGFARTGVDIDPEDGEVIRWRFELAIPTDGEGQSA
jgi:RimJ/RimL family protein N-acetyltransferase